MRATRSPTRRSSSRSCSRTTRSASIQPLAEIGKICREKRRALPHRRGAGRRQGPVRRRGDERRPAVASPAHKIYGPKGVGALYVRRKPRVRLAPQIDGGGHERGMRSGTLTSPRIVGFGKAAEICARRRWPTRRKRLLALRERLLQAASQRSWTRSTSTARSSTGCRATSTSRFAYVEGEALMMAHQGRGGVVRLGLHLGLARAVATCCARSASSDELAHTLDPLRPRPLQHRGGGRLRRSTWSSTQVEQAARDVARSTRWPRKASTSSPSSGRRTEPHRRRGERHGVQRQSHRPLREPAQRRARSTRTTTTSAPAWSARRRAAT